MPQILIKLFEFHANRHLTNQVAQINLIITFLLIAFLWLLLLQAYIFRYTS